MMRFANSLQKDWLMGVIPEPGSVAALTSHVDDQLGLHDSVF